VIGSAPPIDGKPGQLPVAALAGRGLSVYG
jgi:hypothetical protein